MYCTKCGAEVKPGSVYCPNCGAKMKQNAPKKLFVFGGIGAAVLLLLIVLIVSFVFRKTTLVPEDYISYQITGLSTEGNVSLTID